jgi:glutathione synthase/RimK-type ligase-like ATP-grasp enzyme
MPTSTTRMPRVSPTSAHSFSSFSGWLGCGVTKLAIATAAAYPNANADDGNLIRILGELGLDPELRIWNDPTVRWTGYDAVLIRTIWDYHKHYADYLAWLDQLDRLRVPAINDTTLQRWNSDKRYLLELAGRGVDIVPTRVADRNGLRDVLGSMPGRDVVDKPTVSATAWRAVRGTVGESGFDGAVAELPDRDYLVQPFVPEIADAGEWSLLFFDGAYSHAVIKRPASGDYRVQDDFGGTVEPDSPPADVITAADKALAAVRHRHAYARVDGVVTESGFMLMEIELIEPFLFLDTHPGAAEHLARAITRFVGGAS